MQPLAFLKRGRKGRGISYISGSIVDDRSSSGGTQQKNDSRTTASKKSRKKKKQTAQLQYDTYHMHI